MVVAAARRGAAAGRAALSWCVCGVVVAGEVVPNWGVSGSSEPPIAAFDA